MITYSFSKKVLGILLKKCKLGCIEHPIKHGEKKMKKFTSIVTLSTIILISLMSSGCMSYMVMENSKKEIKRSRSAIQAQDLGNGAVGIGFDVGNLEALKEHPWKQLGAAIVDAGLLYGGYVAVKELDDDSGSSSDKSDNNIIVNGNGNVTTIVQGNNNTGNGSKEEDNSLIGTSEE